MKRKYEGLIVLNTKGKEDSVDSMVQDIGKQIEDEGATLEQIDQIGKRKFPYNAQHLEDGFYVNFMFQAEPPLVETLRSKFNLHDDVHLQHYQVRK